MDMWWKSAARTAATLALGTIGSLAITAVADAKAPIACGTIYTISPGDTLFKVADRAYADGWLYKRIYQANRDFLPDEASVEIGDQLLIPCLDGTGPQNRREAVAGGLIADPAQPGMAPGRTEASQEPADLYDSAGDTAREAAYSVDGGPSPSLAEAASLAVPASFRPDEPGIAGNAAGRGAAAMGSPRDARIRMISAGDSAPYAGDTLPDGGMITELLSRALRSADAPEGFGVTFVANGRAHVEDLLADGAFDVGFPWYKPDCARPDRLSAEEQAACRDFEFSAPMVEVRFGYYVRRDSPLALVEAHDGLRGMRLCLPQGQFVSDPHHEGLIGPQVALEAGATAQDCFRKLAEGVVDAVQMVKPDAAGTLRAMGLADAVAEIEAIEIKRTLHAVVARSNPRGQAQLALINRGLRDLMESGAWFEIVASHQSARLARAY